MHEKLPKSVDRFFTTLDEAQIRLNSCVFLFKRLIEEGVIEETHIGLEPEERIYKEEETSFYNRLSKAKREVKELFREFENFLYKRTGSYSPNPKGRISNYHHGFFGGDADDDD